MPTINDYLVDKKKAMLAVKSAIDDGKVEPVALRVDATVQGGSGLRTIRVREHQIITDAPPSMAGYDIGPNAPELMLSAHASCLAHTLIIQSALNDLPIESASVVVTAVFDPRAKTPGFEKIPLEPHDINYEIDIVSSATVEAVREVVGLVEQNCPLFNLIVSKQIIAGTLRHSATQQ